MTTKKASKTARNGKGCKHPHIRVFTDKLTSLVTVCTWFVYGVTTSEMKYYLCLFLLKHVILSAAEITSLHPTAWYFTSIYHIYFFLNLCGESLFGIYMQAGLKRHNSQPQYGNVCRGSQKVRKSVPSTRLIHISLQIQFCLICNTLSSGRLTGTSLWLIDCLHCL